MDEKDITALFLKIIAPRSAGKDLGLDKKTMYEIRNRGLYSNNIGKQLEVLWRAGKLKFNGSIDPEGKT